MSLLGSAIKEAREGTPGMTIRKLAESAEISHTQISRIESGDVLKPSTEVLVAIARALGRNPRPLFVLAGHLSGEEMRDELAPMFREGAELPEEWGEWASVTLDEARELLCESRPNEHQLRRLAADVFSIAESDETLWRPEDALLAVRGEAQRDVQDLLGAWRFIGGERRRRLLEYARALRRLEDLDYLAAIEQLHLESAVVLAADGDGAGAPFGADRLRSEGFEGFVRVTALPPRCPNVPATPGVYVVVRRSGDPPGFLDASVGGHFKGRDPSVATDLLQSKWVDGASTLYVGRTGNLRDRLNLLARFGRSEAVGHWGGRYLWQLTDHDALLAAWQETADYVVRETELVDEFHAAFGALPFANIVRPSGEAQR
jgi:transcriptional regulator with XRE-family HTH domain